MNFRSFRYYHLPSKNNKPIFLATFNSFYQNICVSHSLKAASDILLYFTEKSYANYGADSITDYLVTKLSKIQETFVNLKSFVLLLTVFLLYWRLLQFFQSRLLVCTACYWFVLQAVGLYCRLLVCTAFQIFFQNLFQNIFSNLFTCVWNSRNIELN